MPCISYIDLLVYNWKLKEEDAAGVWKWQRGPIPADKLLCIDLTNMDMLVPTVPPNVHTEHFFNNAQARLLAQVSLHHHCAITVP